jgi:serine/threonine protein kinase
VLPESVLDRASGGRMTTDVGAGAESLRPGDPRELGAYRLVARLGRGGMGTVFLGEGGSGRRVAIKVINPELAGEEAFRERFRREVTAARQVRRFCTAPVIDAQLDQAPLFVVTEFIAGPSLAKVVAERGALADFDLEGLGVGVATALAAIHGAGIVHRDLKPANVLLSATGPRVIDFGIARALDSTGGPTLTGTVVGTPAYLAPELLRGEPVTPASDVFSWGAVMAFAGTGRPPFDGRTLPEILHRVAYDPPALDGLDTGLHALVERALDKQPANRPTTQDLLTELVGHHHAGMPTLAEATRTVETNWHHPAPAPTLADQPAPRDAAADALTVSEAAARIRAQPRPSWRQRRPAWLQWRNRKARIGGGTAAAAALAAVLAFALLAPNGPPTNVRSIFKDNFSNTHSGWYYSLSAYFWTYQNGRLSAQTGLDPIVYRRAPTGGRYPERLLLTVEAIPSGSRPDAEFGAYCRGPDDYQAYVFLIRYDGKRAQLRKEFSQNDKRVLIGTDDVPGFRDTSPQKVQISCEPQNAKRQVRLRLWLNGEQVIEYTDTDKPFANGTAGLAVGRIGNAGNARAEFDNINLAEIID